MTNLIELSSPRRGVLAVVFAIALLTPLASRAQPATDDDARARMHFESGRLHYQEGAYDRALAEFESAYALSHRAMLLVNIASANERLGNYAAATQNLREYLAAAPDAPDRVLLERRIENLERLEAERAARAAEAANVGTPAAEAGAASSQPEQRRSWTAPLTAFGIGGAGLITLAVAGPLALSENNALADGCGATSTCTSSDVAPANRRALVADIGLGVGVAGVVVGTILMFTGRGEHAEGDEASVRTMPYLAPGAAGLSTEVRF
jgi:tetratricopeptide (TPR) repeat protein